MVELFLISPLLMLLALGFGGLPGHCFQLRLQGSYLRGKRVVLQDVFVTLSKRVLENLLLDLVYFVLAGGRLGGFFVTRIEPDFRFHFFVFLGEGCLQRLLDIPDGVAVQHVRGLVLELLHREIEAGELLHFLLNHREEEVGLLEQNGQKLLLQETDQLDDLHESLAERRSDVFLELLYRSLDVGVVQVVGFEVDRRGGALLRSIASLARKNVQVVGFRLEELQLDVSLEILHIAIQF